MAARSVLIMAGGTGGHVYPALAVAEYLRGKGVEPYWLGTRSGLESRVVPENNIQLYTINVMGLRGKSIVRRMLAPLMLIQALLQSLKVIVNLKPVAVIGMGGFVSGPGGIAAWLLRVPLFIHEQNSIAGLTNRLLAPFARVAMQGFPGALHTNKVVTTGNPVRMDIIRKAGSPVERMNGREQQALRLLVLGGSLGARALNELVPLVARDLPGDVAIEVRHQTGTTHIEKTRELYRECGLDDDRLVPYIENMAEAYAWADLVLCRAGALTVSEISIMGLASILVPFPYAVDDHQTANAAFLSDAGAAILIQQADLNKKTLIELFTRFSSERGLLVDMAVRAQERGMPNATRDIGETCLEVAYA